MQVFLLVLLGMILSYALLFLGEIGIVLLGGAAFGLLLYIALNINDKNKMEK
ncbi:hypothetical protein GCM10011351_00690 [Paraliobacillus quinghaiensis]|uniref:Uncharacterized protein n=1 Tax=Paraliobacillus quinghaiensis TaxID=470815 RepID=A0A917TCS4_9BACI|nr:hypothetical protein [Paraliobacillus quinghaiensis]GGM18743.1 hypothetical protein GCM10011351_00690 [Paraliobacillus quinghaiensis]